MGRINVFDWTSSPLHQGEIHIRYCGLRQKPVTRVIGSSEKATTVALLDDVAAKLLLHTCVYVTSYGCSQCQLEYLFCFPFWSCPDLCFIVGGIPRTYSNIAAFPIIAQRGGKHVLGVEKWLLWLS